MRNVMWLNWRDRLPKKDYWLILWCPFNHKTKLFDRIVIRNWWIYRQNLFMNEETGQVLWKDVPFFRKASSFKRDSP